MSRGRTKKRKSRKKLAYGIVAVASILAGFFVYFSLRSSPPEVAIVDHLSFFPDQRNQTFVDTSINILENEGLTVAYYEGEEVTVDFYRNLPSYATSLIVLRVHSAIMKTEEGIISILGLFTSERYLGAGDAARKYPEDVANQRLVEAFFNETERAQGVSYFAIVPEFVEKSMKGNFEDTIIVMMGCEGLGFEGQPYNDMAQAFINKGAKVYIGWDRSVSLSHTDQATIQLLQNLILEKQTIKQAAEGISPDPYWASKLLFYPPKAGDYRIKIVAGSLTLSIIEAKMICVGSRRLRVKSFYKS